MDRLSSEQIEMLVQIVRETRGDGISRDQFNDAMLGLFEDIPGFERLSSRKVGQLLCDTWQRYRSTPMAPDSHTP